MHNKKIEFSKVTSRIATISILIAAPLAFITSLIFIASRKNNASNNKFLNLLIISLSAYVGLMHSSRQVTGDQLEYLYFYNAAKELNFSAYVNLIPARDQIYWYGTYLYSNLLPFGSASFFFLIGFLGAASLLKATHLIARDLALSRQHIVIAFIVVTFSADIFVWSMHLVRQNLAFSISILSLAYLYNRERNIFSSLLFFIVAALIHTSSLFVLVIGYLTFYLNSQNNKVPLLLIFASLYVFFDEIIEEVNLIAINTIGRGLYEYDATHIVARDWLLPQIALWTMLLTTLYILTTKSGAKMKYCINFILLYLLSIYLLLNNNELQLLSYRLLISVYFVIPFFILVVLNYASGLRFSGSKIALNRIFLTVSLLWVARFFYTVGDNYGYPETALLITNPLLVFI